MKICQYIIKLNNCYPFSCVVDCFQCDKPINKMYKWQKKTRSSKQVESTGHCHETKTNIRGCSRGVAQSNLWGMNSILVIDLCRFPVILNDQYRLIPGTYSEKSNKQSLLSSQLNYYYWISILKQLRPAYSLHVIFSKEIYFFVIL